MTPAAFVPRFDSGSSPPPMKPVGVKRGVSRSRRRRRGGGRQTATHQGHDSHHPIATPVKTKTRSAVQQVQGCAISIDLTYLATAQRGVGPATRRTTSNQVIRSARPTRCGLAAACDSPCAVDRRAIVCGPATVARQISGSRAQGGDTTEGAQASHHIKRVLAHMSFACSASVMFATVASTKETWP
jgi:hypothetical protein